MPTQPQADIAVLGHICLDIIPSLRDAGVMTLQPGSLVEIGGAQVSTGGVVSNTGLSLHRLGVRTRLACKVGDDLFGRAIRDVLRAEGAGLDDGLIVDGSSATSYSLVISPPDVDRMFLHCPGANATLTEADIPDAALAGAKLAHFGYPPVMPGFYRDGGAQMAALFERVHAAGAATSLDLCAIDPDGEAGSVDWRAWLKRVLPTVDIFVPSYDEAQQAAGWTGAAEVAEPTADSVAELADDFLSMGAAIVGLKLGDRGLYLKASPDAARLRRVPGLELSADWEGAIVHHPCFRVDVAGATGSGDATIAGLLAALLRGEAPAEAVRSACAVGACCVEAPDAVSGVKPWDEVRRRIDGGWDVHPVQTRLVE